MDDYGREFMVFRAYCQNCGGALRITSDKPARTSKKHDEHDGITGAHKVELKTYVYRCECTLEAERELEQLRKIILCRTLITKGIQGGV
jgi:CMP-2-keto-3-deoxyoctulosonic acid synthetase